MRELGKTLKHKFTLTKRFFYEFGNKSGKMLARALQIKKEASTIHNIKDPSGNSIVTSDGIADQFIKYFTKLYNLPPTKMTGQTPDRTQAIESFLANIAPHLLPQLIRPQ